MYSHRIHRSPGAGNLWLASYEFARHKFGAVVCGAGEAKRYRGAREHGSALVTPSGDWLAAGTPDAAQAVDNYRPHKSEITQRWLRNNPKFRLLFQPVYHPWVNRIERLWKALHDTVTRNHRYRTMDELMITVRRFLVGCQPFPGNNHALATAHV
jgi:transposase